LSKEKHEFCVLRLEYLPLGRPLVRLKSSRSQDRTLQNIGVSVGSRDPTDAITPTGINSLAGNITCRRCGNLSHTVYHTSNGIDKQTPAKFDFFIAFFNEKFLLAFSFYER